MSRGNSKRLSFLSEIFVVPCCFYFLLHSRYGRLPPGFDNPIVDDGGNYQVTTEETSMRLGVNAPILKDVGYDNEI